MVTEPCGFLQSAGFCFGLLALLAMGSIGRTSRRGSERSGVGRVIAIGLLWATAPLATTTDATVAPLPAIAIAAGDSATHASGRVPIGALADTDGDLVPDEFDNCVEIPNGPQQRSNQVDTDRDGYGNACDADYSSGPRDFEVTTADFAIFLYAFTGARPDPETDHDGDGETTAADMAIFLRQFQGEAPLGPGLPCAGLPDCLP
jgi:hypothetical protein